MIAEDDIHACLDERGDPTGGYKAERRHWRNLLARRSRRRQLEQQKRQAQQAPQGDVEVPSSPIARHLNAEDTTLTANPLFSAGHFASSPADIAASTVP